MWTTLGNEAAWLRYTQVTAERLAPGSSITVAWGSGPKEYPCLVCSTVTTMADGTARFISAYVYQTDAKQLLAISAPDDRSVQQAQFNRWLTAQMLTVVHYLVETGICKEDQFENSLTEFAHKVDDWQRDRVAARGTIGRAHTAVLEALDPPG